MSYESSVLLNIFVVLIEVFAFIVFSSAFFQKKITSSKFILSALVLTGLNSICLAISESNVLFKLALLACVYSLWFVVIYRVPSIKYIAISVLFLSFINIADNFLFAGITILKHVDMQELYRDPYRYYLFCYIVKIIELLMFVVFKFAVKQRFHFHHTTWKHWLKIFVLPISSLCIAVFLWRLCWFVPFAAREILFCTIALFIVNAFAVIMLSYLDQEQQLIQDNIVLKQNIKYQNDTVAAWATAYKNQRKMTHDFQNQLSIIYGLAECEAPHGELLPYIQTVMKDRISTSLIVNTGRLVVDVLLSQKYHLAHSKGVHFLFQLDDLTCFGLKDEHLVVVLSNLIDNAIDACEKIADDKNKLITLVMKTEEGSSYLYVENTTAFPVKILDNQVVLPSKQSEEHGYGLKNVAAILNLYNAVFAITYKEAPGLFCFSAQIPETLS
jgi:two-component system sensor histidine kinase AgrC